MGTQEDRMKAVLYQRPEYIPISVSLLPATWIQYREQLAALTARHPLLFGEEDPRQRDFDRVMGTYQQGEHVDNWGCVWSNVHHGMESIVTKHPVPTREAVRTLKAPEKLLGHHPHGFMWLRLQDLRGFEELMVDFAEEPPELQMLLDTVLDYNMRELELRLQTDDSLLIAFGDDLGMQTSLALHPAKWRKYLKPCYARIYGRCHEAGRYVFMHTDGHIVEIIPDLVECGVNIINPQVRANGLQNLATVAKGKVCLSLDLDRQMFPFATPAEIDAHVREVAELLGAPEGGLWMHAECAPDVPLANIEAICTALETYRAMYT
ncbi:MAG: uroporphyrinogen decarboxylase family protein [Anaerolineae bacterium]